MAGIVFIRTTNLARVVEFYKNIIGMTTWLEQPSIEILQHDNMLLGFHEQKVADTDALITFFYDSKTEVDEMYLKIKGRAKEEPKENEKYQIYNFFAEDPDGRMIEFQKFLNELKEY